MINRDNLFFFTVVMLQIENFHNVRVYGKNLNMKDISKIIVFSILGVGGVVSPSFAASGDSTLTLGYAHFQFPGLNDFIKSVGVHNRSTVNSFVNNSLISSGQYTNASVTGYEGKEKSPQGINIKYRYEITDDFGVITSFTWTRSLTNTQSFVNVEAVDKNTQIKNPAASGRTDIRANYWSVLAGPTWRFNDYVSLYAMTGMGVAKVNADFKIKDNLNIGAGNYSVSDSIKKISLAWAAGAQFNFNESVTMDVAYEGSGSGDWRSSGMVVGIGLKF